MISTTLRNGAISVSMENARAVEYRALGRDSLEPLHVRTVNYKPTDTSVFDTRVEPVKRQADPKETENREIVRLCATIPMGVIRVWRVGGRALSGATVSKDGEIFWIAYDSEMGKFTTFTRIECMKDWCIRKAANGRRGDAVFGRRVK